MLNLIQMRDNEANSNCYDTFPTRIAYYNTYDPYHNKTIYERILLDMDEAIKENDDQA